MPGSPVSSTRPQPVHQSSPQSSQGSAHGLSHGLSHGPSHGPSRRPSHRQQGPKRGRLALGAGIAAAVTGLGVAVGVGAIPSPLSSGSAEPLAAATLTAPTPNASEALLQASASPLGSYAIAKMPATTHKPKPAPSKTTATPTPTHTTAAPPASHAVSNSNVLAAQATAKYETPRGQNQKAWSEAILNGLGAPLTTANILSIGYWMQNEAGSPPYGIVGANNPINVSEPCCGGTPIQDDGDGVTFLQSYPTVADGVAAIAKYLNRGNYTTILADLKSGAGLMDDPNLASEIGLYSGGGYTTIPDDYGRSQGQPLS